MKSSSLEHTPLSDREKLFYEVETKFVDISVQHFRGLATISATELGFLLTSLTLAGTNELAKNFVTRNEAFGVPIIILLLVSVIAGSLYGRFFSLNLLYGSRSGFIPDDARVKLIGLNLNEEQIKELLEVPDNEAKELKKHYELNARLTSCAGWATTIGFGLANLVITWLILSSVFN